MTYLITYFYLIANSMPKYGMFYNILVSAILQPAEIFQIFKTPFINKSFFSIILNWISVSSNIAHNYGPIVP